MNNKNEIVNIHNPADEESLPKEFTLPQPVDDAALRHFVQTRLGLKMPDRSVCPQHDPPLAYLADVFFERVGDCVIWSCRGGGKTQLGALASLMDCLFKPGCQIRILGGSLDQSQRMYHYLRQMIACGFEKQLARKPTATRLELDNGSVVEVLAQSEQSVRGHHVQKLRCDELELFSLPIWQAAQFVTKTSRDGSIRGSLEAYSTMFRPYGLMKETVAQAEKNGRRVYRWCLLDVLETCLPDRSCSRCPLDEDCRGKARNADGFFAIDDAIAIKARASREAWQAEMLCRRPARHRLVFQDFDPDLHVRHVAYTPSRPLYRTLDFGYTNPFVCLWLQLGPDDEVWVIDEYLRTCTTISVHAEVLHKRTPGPVVATYCDPAGQARTDVTGTSAVAELRAAGIAATFRRSGIMDGLEMIRR